MRAGFLLSEVRIGLRRNLTMTFAVIVTTAISLSLLGIGLLSNAQVNAMKDYWYDKIEVSVFLCGPLSESPSCAGGVITDAQRTTIKADLEALPVVQSVYYESQSEAFSRFQERFKDSAIAQNVSADQLPESFRVKLDDPTQFAVVVSAFTGRPGVDVVQDQRTILEKFFELLNVLRNGAIAVGLASVLTAALLISNTLRIAAFNRRRETGVMKLVGASSFSIQLPFLLEGIISAIIGWGVATGLLAGLKQVVDTQVAPLLTFTNYFCFTHNSSPLPQGLRLRLKGYSQIMVKEVGRKLIAQNKKARHDYSIEDVYECGIVLTGTEVKSLRAGRASLIDGYAHVSNGELWLSGVHIPEYTEGTWNNHTPRRERKLLVHMQELRKLHALTKEGGLTLIPLQLYFKDGKAKIEIALARGKKAYDKRAALKERQDSRDVEREMSRRKTGKDF
jgi:cell division transport system permease protein